ncbi:MAG: hypothetical protein DMF55_07300 [Acidobacteria bacterium]|nr:MAG: hypothetical protein DMF55_07300 [Acidobacteriota bacterium]
MDPRRPAGPRDRRRPRVRRRSRADGLGRGAARGDPGAARPRDGNPHQPDARRRKTHGQVEGAPEAALRHHAARAASHPTRRFRGEAEGGGFHTRHALAQTDRRGAGVDGRGLRPLPLRVTRPPVGALPPDVLRRIAPVRKLALETGTTLYLVGGAVRDLLLGRAITDLDLVVEADAVVFARRLAHDLHAAVETHRRFGTAVLRLPEGERLDVATARAEDYETPGALPRVRAGSIDDDLARRDFTVNAMAMRIGRSNRPDFLDPFGGRRDLRARLVRALHPRSSGSVS